MVRGFTSEETLLYQKDFASLLKKPLTTVNYNLTILKRQGLLTGLNFLTPDGKVVFQKLKRYLDNTKKLRGHKIFGKFNLSCGYDDFDSVRGKYLRISKSEKHKGFRVDFKDCIVLFYSPRKVCFYLPDVYGDSIEEIYGVAFEEYIYPLQSYLEKMFEGLKIDKYEICSVTINHLALRFNPLAELFKACKVRYVSDRLEVDHSHNVAELETVNKKHAVEDMDKILDYEKIVRGSFSYNGKKEDGSDV